MNGTRRYLHEKSSPISLWDKGQIIRKAQSKVLHSGIAELWPRIDYQDIDKCWTFYGKLQKQVKRIVSHLENKAPTPNFEDMLDTDSHEEYSHVWDDLSTCPITVKLRIK